MAETYDHSDQATDPTHQGNKANERQAENAEDSGLPRSVSLSEDEISYEELRAENEDDSGIPQSVSLPGEEIPDEGAGQKDLTPTQCSDSESPAATHGLETGGSNHVSSQSPSQEQENDLESIFPVPVSDSDEKDNSAGSHNDIGLAQLTGDKDTAVNNELNSEKNIIEESRPSYTETAKRTVPTDGVRVEQDNCAAGGSEVKQVKDITPESNSLLSHLNQGNVTRDADAMGSAGSSGGNSEVGQDSGDAAEVTNSKPIKTQTYGVNSEANTKLNDQYCGTEKRPTTVRGAKSLSFKLWQFLLVLLVVLMLKDSEKCDRAGLTGFHSETDEKFLRRFLHNLDDGDRILMERNTLTIYFNVHDSENEEEYEWEQEVPYEQEPEQRREQRHEQQLRFQQPTDYGSDDDELYDIVYAHNVTYPQYVADVFSSDDEDELFDNRVILADDDHIGWRVERIVAGEPVIGDALWPRQEVNHQIRASSSQVSVDHITIGNGFSAVGATYSYFDRNGRSYRIPPGTQTRLDDPKDSDITENSSRTTPRLGVRQDVPANSVSTATAERNELAPNRFNQTVSDEGSLPGAIRETCMSDYHNGTPMWHTSDYSEQNGRQDDVRRRTGRKGRETKPRHSRRVANPSKVKVTTDRDQRCSHDETDPNEQLLPPHMQPAQHPNILGPNLSIPPIRLPAGIMNQAQYNDTDLVGPLLPTVAGLLSDPPPVNETKEEFDDDKG